MGDTYGLIDDGNTNWDNSYGFITSTEVSDAYVNVTGDTMTGNLTMASGTTVDGVDVSALNTSVSSHTGATSSVHGVSGSVVGTSSTQTLTNKTLGATSMSADLSMGSSADINMSANRTVDGVDVSSMLNLTNSSGANVLGNKVYFRVGTRTDGQSIPLPDGYASGDGTCMCTGSFIGAIGNGGEAGIDRINVTIPTDCSDTVTCTCSDEDGGGCTDCTISYLEICIS